MTATKLPTVAGALLLAAFGSVVDEETVAVDLTPETAWSAFTVTVTVAEPPDASVPSEQVVPVQVPTLGTAETSEKPVGSDSFATTALAAFGPAFATPTVKTMFVPTFAGFGDGEFVTERSADPAESRAGADALAAPTSAAAMTAVATRRTSAF